MEAASGQARPLRAGRSSPSHCRGPNGERSRMTNDAVVHVIDDDLAVRRSLAFLLASDGLPVRLHESAAAFLGEIGEPVSGCVVTDVRMPEMDGLELLRRLKEGGS